MKTKNNYLNCWSRNRSIVSWSLPPVHRCQLKIICKMQKMLKLFLNVIFVFTEIKKSWSQIKKIAYFNSTFSISRDVAITVQAIYIFNISRKKEIQNSSRKFILSTWLSYSSKYWNILKPKQHLRFITFFVSF